MAAKKRKTNPKAGNEDDGPELIPTSETPNKLTTASQKRKGKSQLSAELVGDDDSTEDVQISAKRPKSTSVTPAKRKAPPRKRKASPKNDGNDEGGSNNDEEEDDQAAERKKPKRETQSKRTATPCKSKTHPKHEDDDGGDQIAGDEQLAASLAAPPPTRTSASRLRKANPKYADEDDEDIEDDEFVERAQPTKGTPKKRTPASRAAKVNRNDPEWLVTNENSPLAYEDLHAELSNPKTYEGFTKEDWEDLRSTLPADVPLNPDGYSISDHFLKYNPDFRRGIREFQEDLSTGRLDPKWQAAAAEAMEQRARGDFDAWKEKNYEEFWGQKQKLQPGVLAGDSTKVTLKTMIENGMFQVGDEVVFSRVIGRKEKRVLIEKELKIIAVGEDTLTFAIPPGQQKFARQTTAPQPPTAAKADEAEAMLNKTGPQADRAHSDAVPMDNDKMQDDGDVEDNVHVEQGEKLVERPSLPPEVHPVPTDLDADTTGVEAAQETVPGDEGIDAQMRDHDEPDGSGVLAKCPQPPDADLDTSMEGNEAAVTATVGDETGKPHDPGTIMVAEGAFLAAEDQSADVGSRDEMNMAQMEDVAPKETVEKGTQTSDANVRNSERGGSSPLSELSNGEIPNGEIPNGKSAATITNKMNDKASTPESKPPDPPDGVIHHEIKNLAQLMNKAIEIDGRLDPKDIKQVPASSPWKFMRLKRNNQDLGTLFEMRDEFYAYKLPKLQKKAKG